MDETKPTDSESGLPNLSNDEPFESTAMPKRSRLQKTLENNSKHTLFLSLGAIFALILLLYFVGLPLFVKLAEFTSKDDVTKEATDDETVVIPPPDLTPPFNATNSAEITLQGTAEEGDRVKLYQDSKLVGEVKVTSNASFNFRNVELREGKNSFKAKAIKGDNESRLSNPITIAYRKDAPKLSIDYPSEGQGISNKDGDRLQIEGSTDSDITVTVNGSQAVVDGEGKFKHVIPIKGGENSIKVVATDDAGNKTELERKFTYNP